MLVAPPVLHHSAVEDQMLDLVFLAIGLGGFVLMGAYATLCDRL